MAFSGLGQARMRFTPPNPDILKTEVFLHLCLGSSKARGFLVQQNILVYDGNRELGGVLLFNPITTAKSCEFGGNEAWGASRSAKI
ncbi:hypothetical protein E4U40_002363 [Claviceps sp. LM458 group G5]|nr:hypothetical protein E4U40_002363 [Claviceps sp. LM458 group G5]